MASNGTPVKRPRLAAVVTSYKKYLHPQHVVDRFLDGYGWNGTYHHSEMDVVSLYVDQRGEGDLFQERADRHPGMKIYPTIAEALTLGTGKLAVDGVVVVAEHGVTRSARTASRCARITSSSNRSPKYSAPAAAPSLTSTTKSSRGTGSGPRRWSTARRVGFPASGRIEPGGDLAGSVRGVSPWAPPRKRPSPSATAAGQLRFPRAGDDPVHGGAPQGRRDGSRVAADLSRATAFWRAHRGGGVVAGVVQGRVVPQRDAETGRRPSPTSIRRSNR